MAAARNADAFGTALKPGPGARSLLSERVRVMDRMDRQSDQDLRRGVPPDRQAAEPLLLVARRCRPGSRARNVGGNGADDLAVSGCDREGAASGSSAAGDSQDVSPQRREI